MAIKVRATFATLVAVIFMACEDSQPPVACGTLPQQSVHAGESTSVIACFNDPNGDLLTYAAVSSNPAVAVASAAGSTVVITGASPGNASVAVTATDPDGMQGQQTFQVQVPNRAPLTRGAIPAQTITVGHSATVNLSSYFTEPDGEKLTYSATAADPTVVSTSPSASALTVTAVARGTTDVTATATDPGGLTATQVFQVVVPNRAPVTASAIPGQTVESGETVGVDISSHFRDPDGDSLSYEAVSSDPATAGVAVYGDTVAISGVARGEATITATATDQGGLTATQVFQVVVPNRAPVTASTIPGQTVQSGETVGVDVSSNFRDPDGDSLTYEAVSSDPAAAGVAVYGETVAISGVARGEATITVTATDQGGLTATQVFQVVVPNRAPVTASAIPGQTVHSGEMVGVDVSPNFRDPDGDSLTYEAVSSDPATAGVAVYGDTVAISGVARGQATITVTASDQGGLTATQVFQVVVPNRAPVVASTIPGQTVESGEMVGVDVSSNFRDPDGDSLTFEAVSSDPATAGVAVYGDTVAISGVARGQATITVTASDQGGLTATQVFQVVVPNRAPVVASAIPGQNVDSGETVGVDVSSNFRDPDGDSLTFEAVSSDPATAGVAVFGTTVAISGVARGEATIAVTASDQGGLTATQVFQVVVPNRAPVAVSTISGQTVGSGEMVGVDVSSNFSDPDGDSLTYEAVSSDPATAGVAVYGDTVAISGVARGEATITVTATDPGGLTATQVFQVVVFQVAVPNRAPVAVSTISGQTVGSGEMVGVDVSSYFSDPDGDPLTYEAVSSDPATAGVAVYGDTVAITGVAGGQATITVTATDPGGLTATQVFQVAVPNRAPVVASAIPGQTVHSGETVGVDVSPNFSDPDGDSLTYEAVSSDPATAGVAVFGTTVAISGVARGEATIAVTASDPGGLTATQVFQVVVPNRAPVTAGTIPGQTVDSGETVGVDVSSYFSDPDGDPLTYEAVSSDPATAGVAVFGTTVVISGVARGEATITVTASDPDGLIVQSAFPVDVIGNDGGSFRIELVFATEMTSAQESAFRDPAERWMSILAETELRDLEVNGTVDCGGEYEQSVGTIDDLMIVAAVVEIDGPGGTLARAGPCWIRSDTGLPFFGVIEFDVADLERLENNGTMRPVILHEMGHVLGIGTLWEHFDLLRNPSSANEALDTHFAGRLAIEAFDSAGGVGYTGGGKVPVENRGGPATHNSHWRASVFGNELMIGRLGRTTPLSAITIQSLADLGYKVDASQADAYRLPDAAALASMLENSIDLGNDVLRVPIVVVDRNGLIVRVIPPN